MSAPVNTRDPGAVAAEVQAVYLALFPDGDRLFVSRAFGWAVDCFTGHFAAYQAIDASYHDFEHTLQGALCLARLLHGRHRANAQPVLTRRFFELGMLAILLHDTGYLKKGDDREGTGAKYTVTHVGRSVEFASELLTEKGYASGDIQAVQNMIRCTGVDAHPDMIPFAWELERMTGLALTTADLLGQMAAEDYLQRLPELYAEFAEAAAFDGNPQTFVASFESAEDLIARTPQFWDGFVKPKLSGELDGLHRFLNEPYPDGPNDYLDRIEAHMTKLRRRQKPARPGG
jgi:hypothetical protein